MKQVLTPAALQEGLTSLPGWAEQKGALYKKFQFRDFREAFGAMAQGALISEALDHHPDWKNVYSRLEITLSTHDAGGITERDILWARSFEEAVSRESSD